MLVASRARCSSNEANRGRKAWTARPRWLTAFFSSSASSAIVRASPATRTAGRNRSRPAPRGSRVIVPSQVPSTTEGRDASGLPRDRPARARSGSAPIGARGSTSARAASSAALFSASVAPLVGEARRANAGAPAERVDLEPGVVGEGEHRRRLRRSRDRLDSALSSKRRAVLDHRDARSGSTSRAPTTSSGRSARSARSSSSLPRLVVARTSVVRSRHPPHFPGHETARRDRRRPPRAPAR